MAQEQDQSTGADFVAGEASVPPARRVRWRVWMMTAAVVLLIALGLAWAMRKEIADNVIAGQLDSLGLPAHYEIVSIGPSEQVVRNLVIGDPDAPDLTVEEIRVATRLDWGLPGIGRITVVHPRLYGALRGGKMSFGTLDKALFSGEGGPFEMPDLDVAIEDGRALIESDYGRIGAKLDGAGALRGGFAGELAAIAPKFAVEGCAAGQVSLYGKVTVASLKPRFEGPVRLKELTCPDAAVRLVQAGLQLDVTLDKALDGGEGKLGLRAREGRYGENRLGEASGTAHVTYRDGGFNVRYDLAASGLDMPQARFASLSFDGRARLAGGLARFDIDGDLGGKGIALGPELDSSLAGIQQAGEGTLLAPLAAQARAALQRETRGSSLTANLILRRTEEGYSLVVPRGALRGGSGASLVTLSRVQAMFGAQGLPLVTGSFATGGRGLPRVSGRMESGADGRLAMHVSMPAYSDGANSLSLPQLAMVQDAGGALRFTGQAELTGDLPGGRAGNLIVPVEGLWAANGDLSLWPRCTQVAFHELQFANLTLDRRSLSVCPADDGAIVRGRSGVFRIAAGVAALDLSGRLGETPVRIASGPLGFAMSGAGPGTVKASALKVDLGPAAGASHFAVSDLEARVGQDVGGTFTDADVRLYAVPLDLLKTGGAWHYSKGVLTLDGAHFTLVDRQQVARFNPMIARDATLRLKDNVITAQALVREPESDREVVRADIVHDLATAGGHADLTVDGLRFDDKLQADTLSTLALGVVSNLEGSVDGTGRIDWNEKGVTSHGRIVTAGMDFAAPFGPVKGLSGQVVFTDLLGFVTAPDQKLHLASINPGIEVTDGIMSFEMKPDYFLQINGARWPFMNGTLTLEPAHMKIGVAETRYYTLKVVGLDASTFVRHLDMSNLNATGVFDGELPLIFDENGGRIEEGHLVSRPPGGNVAYVGELTYKDLSAMGNFAFDMLKSVDFKRMEISLGGTLAGEIITRVSFNGISQGIGAKQNFLTKQVAKLPIRFVLNIKAPFFSLFAPLRSLYDPNYVVDPRTLGLIGTDGRIKAAAQPGVPAIAIQPSVSEKTP
ncbi:intermembrane phospholipid transport protein YdbH family protein [Novosphingobium album (ex Hu et al. 2023)]|uniref:YdbH domain-containing protein n=1 Tax=Novosphingobium album (ex Hu et al. 2023) TaxID=2930093 RepID=A0ABT0AWR0_9SPHN|nr:YdbH domain-containing protein [Novosphingobium album (ex Hu et al. 2023)]MCJ2177048.1 YdbH domain-containing protein [Novosphingobium album (ex Hu et al. 2023)]